MTVGNFVSYLRVSTQRQGQSGLGLEAQRQTVTDFLNGGNWTLIGEFIEVETGKGKNALSKRPKLAEALAACKKHKAVLVIARLDRLARNVHFISGLMESGVEFCAVDMPQANRLTVHILAAVAEDEARRISERTKAALKAAKARGTVLGRHGTVLGQQNRQQALDHARQLASMVRDLRHRGLTVRRLTAELNARSIPTPRGGRWHVQSVHRLLKRIDHHA